jgi:hypothetical protein
MGDDQMNRPLSITSDWKVAAACPAAWHAERVARVYTREPKECFATGSLFHAALLTPDRIPAVYAEYGDLLTLSRAGKTGKAGEPNAAARQALADAEYVRTRPQVAELLDGGKCETEVRFELDGVPWIAHIDLITAGGCVCDAKTCRDIVGSEWDPVRKARVPWHEALLYWHQLAVYRKAVGAEAVALIACQSCAEPPPDVRIIERSACDDDLLDQYAADVEASMRHEWTSPVTGQRMPSFVAMQACPDAAALTELFARYDETGKRLARDFSRCESPSCGWCRKSREDLFFPYAAERGKGV